MGQFLIVHCTCSFWSFPNELKFLRGHSNTLLWVGGLWILLLWIISNSVERKCCFCFFIYLKWYIKNRKTLIMRRSKKRNIFLPKWPSRVWLWWLSYISPMLVSHIPHFIGRAYQSGKTYLNLTKIQQM